MRYIKIIVLNCFYLLSLITSNVYALEKVKFNNGDTFCLNNNWHLENNQFKITKITLEIAKFSLVVSVVLDISCAPRNTR